VTDSDREKEDEKFGATTLRIQTEFDKHFFLVWVTSGRTIENYTSERLFNEAVALAHPRIGTAIPRSRFFAVVGSDVQG